MKNSNILTGIEQDAVRIFTKYLAREATHPISITDDLRNETISKYFLHIGLDRQNFQHKIVNISLPIIFSICFGCSKEPSQQDGSFEYPQDTFWLRNKKIIFLVRTLNLRPVSRLVVY